MVHARSPYLLWLLTAALAACGGSDGGQDAPLDGMWLGDHLDFSLCDGVLRNVQVQDVSCAALQDGAPCSRDAEGPLAGGFSVIDGGVTLRTDRLEIIGSFQGVNRFVGTYTLLDPTCCAVTGDLEVRYHPGAGACQGGADTAVADVADEGGAEDGSPEGGGEGVADVAQPDGDAATVDGIDPARALAALELVNAARAAAGAPAITVDERLVQAAQAHADYVAKWFDNYNLTQMSVHDEDPDWSGFTGVKFRDRVEHFGYPFTSGWEIIAFFNDPAKAVATWMETLYHRVPIVHPNAFQLGYGGAKVGGARVDVMDFAGTWTPEAPAPVAWPHDGMANVATRWEGKEEPQPYLPAQLGEPDGYPSGPVITLEFPFSTDVTAATFDLVDNGGAAVPAQVLGPADAAGKAQGHPFTADAHLVGTYALIPFDPVAAHTRFTAHFSGTLDGAPFEKTWSFSTRAEP